jgi:hypothetical protein
MDLILGSHPAVESLGEVKKIPFVQASIREGTPAKCNCGSTVAECGFWQQLLRGGNGFDEKDPRSNAELFANALSFRGRNMILDNSKNSGRVMMLSRSGLFEIQVLHVVRDSRAVVFSHRRKAERRTHDNSYRLFPTVRNWNRLNLRLASTFEKASNTSYLRVKYEDVVADPEKEIKRILEQLGLVWMPQILQFREARHHGIEGNRMRLGGGQEIVRDAEYLDGLGRSEWWAATAASWRGLRKFGYRLRRQSAKDELLRKA